MDNLEYIDMWSKKVRAISLLGGQCNICKIKNPLLLEFHHTGTDKEVEINRISTCRWSRIEAEIKKCILLCKNCHNALHYPISKTKYQKNKILFLKYKNTDHCIKCGYKESNCSLNFHHCSGKKEFAISKATHRHLKFISDINQEIKDELDKCIILCFNCHVLEHMNIDKFNSLKNLIYEKANIITEKQRKLDRTAVINLYDGGMIQRDIAIKFNASKGTICGIIKEYKNSLLTNEKNSDIILPPNIDPLEKWRLFLT